MDDLEDTAELLRSVAAIDDVCLMQATKTSTPNLPASRGRANMTDFYEELADFAAMSEDDGFLGQCAGADADLPAASIETNTSGKCGIARMQRGPQQSQLLVVMELTRTF